MLKISNKVNFNNFGYIPKGNLFQDLYGKFFGYPNLYKRLQAKSIFEVLNLKKTDSVLDLGCGTGYFTIEMAKMARYTIGIDIDPLVKNIKVPETLKDKLEFLHAKETTLPFEDNSLDTVFCSEVIGQLPSPSELILEVKRVLKPNGKFVVVNGCGHPYIEEAYSNQPDFFKKLQSSFSKSFPLSYNEYCTALNQQFSNHRNTFFSLKEVRDLLIGHQFKEQSVTWAPKEKFGEYFSKNMFVKYVKTGNSYKKSPIDYIKFIIQYHYFKNKNQGTKDYESGLIYEAINN